MNGKDYQEAKDKPVVENAPVLVNPDGDEALLLVGIERQKQFGDEYNRRLLRKLVCLILYFANQIDASNSV
jgi:hypothetical protein